MLDAPIADSNALDSRELDAGTADTGVDAGPGADAGPAPDWPAFGGVSPGDDPIHVAFDEPGYLEFVTDPRTELFDDGRVLTQVARVSDNEAFGLSTNRLQHQYAKVSPWNSDNSLALFFATGPTRAVLVDGRTYAFMRIVPNVFGGGRWSTRDPNIYYQKRAGADLRLLAYDVLTDEVTTIHDFADEGYVEQSGAGLFGGEGNQSVDDRMWALSFRHGTRDRWEVVIWDNELGEVTGAIAVPESPEPGSSNLDYMAVSPLGTYIVIYADSAWTSDGASIPGGMNVFSTSGEYLRSVNAGGHLDFCLDTDGEEVVAFIRSKYESNDKVFQTWRLDGSQGDDTTDQISDGIIGWTYHISCASTSRPGYAIVSDAPSATPGSYNGFPMWNHLWAVRLDGSGDVGVIGEIHHNNVVDNASYYRSSFGVANRDLSAVWFSTAWDDIDAMVHSYVARPAR